MPQGYVVFRLASGPWAVVSPKGKIVKKSPTQAEALEYAAVLNDRTGERWE